MANEFRYTLQFDTALNPAGSDAARRAVEQVDDAAARASRRSGESAAQTVRGLTDQTDAARVSEFAYYDLDAAMARTGKTSETFTAGATQVQRSSANASQSLLMFSQGFEDAQYGIRGVLNNIPGLVMALGGTMGLAGAISIAAVSFSVLYDWLSKTDEKVKFSAETLAEFGQNAADLVGERIDDAIAQIGDIEAAAAAVTQGWAETQKAENAAATAVLSNAEKVAESQREISRILGEQVDAYAEIEAIAAAAEAQRVEESRQAMAAEEARLVAAQEAVAMKEQKLNEALVVQAQAQRDLETVAAEIESRRAEIAQLSAVSTDRIGFMESLSEGGIPGLLRDPAAGTAARERLQDPAFQAETQALEAKLEELQKRVGDQSGTLNRAVTIIDREFGRAQRDLADVSQSVATNIATIEATLNADALVAQVEQVKSVSEMLADDLGAAMGAIQTSDARTAEAKAGIEQAAADGQITADEMVGLARNMQTLIGSLQAGIAVSNGSQAELIALMFSYQEEQSRQREEIQILKAKSGR